MTKEKSTNKVSGYNRWLNGIEAVGNKLLASGRNDHSASGEINQFQPLENSQCTSATPFLS